MDSFQTSDRPLFSIDDQDVSRTACTLATLTVGMTGFGNIFKLLQ